ncbi:CoA ester lyase [Sphingomonas sp. BIUV-7]|uniref:CoA ester lyase n=1 Tax=Sphingomonas natans TaxID=3063330 RepID=A0ABT8Y7Y3_9SPHN|nr:CoA ester lyase [Sphingomonas sp. BIUV-7]MDO6414428.1 CoA ester lyase [Sphingomonas sp. BIUV-7]
MPEPLTLKMRSWLFAPGDSSRKMTNAIASQADIILLDLEDSVVCANKPLARQLVPELLNANPAQRTRLWVRINPLDGSHALTDLAAIMPFHPGGIMLPKVNGRQDVEQLDHYLSAFEAAHGIVAGSTPVIALITETAKAMFHTGSYEGAPRVAALTWGAEDLADSIGAMSNLNPDGSYGFVYELARSMCLLGAATASVPAIETIHSDFRDLDALKLRTEQVRRAGYSGMLAIHPTQIEVINAAFTPTEPEIAEARAIVDVFAANPGVGAIAYLGRMVDRPHLARARKILSDANAAQSTDRVSRS